MAHSKKKARPRARRKDSRLPSIPLLGGHVNYMRPRPRKRPQRSWSLRVNHHQRSGSPFSHCSRTKKQQAKRLAAKIWHRAKPSSLTLLEKAKRNESFRKAIERLKQCSCKGDNRRSKKTANSHPARDGRPQTIRKHSIRRVIDKLVKRTKQTSQRVIQKREDFLFAINTSTKLADVRSKAVTLRDDFGKSFDRKKKLIMKRIEGTVAKVGRKIVEETGNRVDLLEMSQRRGNAEQVKTRVYQTRGKAVGDKNTAKRAKEKRLWGSRVGPAPEKKWKI